MIIYIDTETTGTDERKHGIWQIAGLIVDERNPEKTEVHHFDYKVNKFDGDEIDDYALQVGNVTKEQIESFEKPRIAYEHFFDTLKKYVDPYEKNSAEKERLTIKGWYVGFDERMLRAWFIKNGNKYFNSTFYSPVIDIAGKVADFLIESNQRKDYTSFKLEYVAKKFGIDLSEYNLHDAKDDIRLTMDVETKLIEISENYYNS